MSEVNFSVLNALNLINRKLGKAYQEKGFNPFGEQYNLDYLEAVKWLNLKEEKTMVEPPEFLEFNQNKLSNIITSAQNKAYALQAEIEKVATLHLENQNIQEQVIYLKICAELLRTLSSKNPNYEEILEVFRLIMAMSKDLGKLYQKIFYKEVELQLIIQQCLKLAGVDMQKNAKKEQELIRAMVHNPERKTTQKNKAHASSKTKEKLMEK